jgi:hypothetical protein
MQGEASELRLLAFWHPGTVIPLREVSYLPCRLGRIPWSLAGLLDLSCSSQPAAEIPGEEPGMTAAAQPGSDDELGPVDFLAIEFPGGQLTAPGFEQLLALADQGVVQILDMEFIAKDVDGKSKKVDVWEFAVPEGVDLGAWAGASSGLLDDSDVGEISAAMQPGSVAVVVIYENRWVLGLVDAWRHDGARLIAEGGLSADDIVAALDATEPS